MQFRSAKFWSSISFKFSASSLLACALLLPQFAGAVVNISPLSKQSGNAVLSNIVNGAYYYPVIVTKPDSFSLGAPVAAGGTLYTGYDFIDVGQDADFNQPTTQPGDILFNVQSTASGSSGAVVIAVYATGPSSTELVPIASLGNAMCGNGDGGQCLYQVASNGGTISNLVRPYFYAVNYTAGSLTQIGINLQSVCRSFRFGGQTALQGCDSLYFTGNTTSPGPITLNIGIFKQSDILALNQATPVVTLPTPVESTSLKINLVSLVSPTALTPTLSCNLTAGAYLPQDSGIQVDTTRFTISGDPVYPTPAQILVVAKLEPTAFPNDQTTNYFSGNDIATAIQVNGLQVVGNFKNSTAAGEFDYKVGFLPIDGAGFIFGGGASHTCSFPNDLSVSDIQGFLKANKCFIATAVFRTGDRGPIHLLRTFRDQFLEHHSLGRRFIGWYYAWSPDAADWLIDHPIFRFPVLLGLIPLQMLAWTILHPLVMVCLGIFGAIILGFGLAISVFRPRYSRRKMEEA